MRLLANNIHKHYGGAYALRGVSLEVGQGEIHALLGANGAGKSTLIKILAGVETPEMGQVLVGDKALRNGFSPTEASQGGLRFVHQDLGLIDQLSIAENVALETGYALRGGFISFRATEARVRDRLRALAPWLSPDRLVGDLSQAEKVMVAIARSLDSEARVIVLDEVTSSLPAPEAKRLHDFLRSARAQGTSFVFVTHRLEEIFGFCDRVTVLANGRVVQTADVAAIDHETLVHWIVGHAVAIDRLDRARAPGAPALSITSATGSGVPDPFDLAVGEGEIVAITGMIGSGYNQLAQWLCGTASPHAGGLCISGQDLPWGDPERLRAAGCHVVLGDRSACAFPDLTVRENLFPHALAAAGVPPFMLADERRRADQLIHRFSVRPSHCGEMAIRSLSGGNQQKIVFLRAIERRPKVLVLLDPTLGVDIGARQELYRILRSEVDRGLATILASSDFDEVATLADRAIVLNQGRIGAVLAGENLTPHRLTVESHRPAAASRSGEAA